MFSAILKILPKLDVAALNTMQRNLTSRFTKIAKGFGKGLVTAIKGGGIVGIGLALVDKLLNPLKEIQEAIDKTLHSSDDIATNAKQFNTSSGKLAKLIALGEATGLDQEGLFMLINKFQNAVAEAEADPNVPSSVRNFIGKEDTAEAFFEFMQGLQSMDKNSQLRAQQNVFGEKQTLKMADFLQSDFASLYKKIHLDKINTGDLSKKINYLEGLADKTDELTAERNLRNYIGKAGVIKPGMVTADDVSKKIALRRENNNIANYNNLKLISDRVDKIAGFMEQMLGKVGGFIPKIEAFIDRAMLFIDKLKGSYLFRGIFGKKD